MKNVFNFLIVIIFSISAYSCNEYLDAKPDKSLVVPQSLSDLQTLLDNDNIVNLGDPIAGDVSCDDYYIAPTYYNQIPTLYKDTYSWNPSVRNDADWKNAYTKAYLTNIVLDNIDKVSRSGASEASFNSIKGSAYFIRGWSLFLATQVYTMPYHKGVNDEALGMPIKKTSDINDPTVRGTLKDTYKSIIDDITFALQYLPVENNPVSRPNKASAYAALACIYLQIQNWKLASQYADSSLQIRNALLDFNTLDSNARAPIPKTNIEMIYQSRIVSVSVFSITGCRVDSTLYSSYNNNDLRKSVFYQLNTDGTHYFKGQFDGNTSQALFSGISVDEMYLVKAECSVRLNDLGKASDALNSLLVKRYKAGNFQRYVFTDQANAMKVVLSERRKELAFRGNRRWWDLRRLNLESAFAVIIKRNINEIISELPPNNLRYAFLIPESAVAIGGAQQNVR